MLTLSPTRVAPKWVWKTRNENILKRKIDNNIIPLERRQCVFWTPLVIYNHNRGADCISSTSIKKVLALWKSAIIPQQQISLAWCSSDMKGHQFWNSHNFLNTCASYLKLDVLDSTRSLVYERGPDCCCNPQIAKVMIFYQLFGTKNQNFGGKFFWSVITSSIMLSAR